MQGGIDTVHWTVYGKIDTILKSNGTVIAYRYDAGGNRISKAVTTGGTTKTTWYARDASGNVMAVYSDSAGSMYLKEQHLYGSSRLGLVERSEKVGVGESVPQPDANGYTELSGIRGEKRYELSNHLGNNLVVISDKKTGVDTNSDGIADYYTSDVVSATDYYPFGMSMPGRSYQSGLYRYGFNGKENG